MAALCGCQRVVGDWSASAYSVDRLIGTIHQDFPLVDIGFIYKAHVCAWRWFSRALGELL
jgi:hypothetical protein